MSLARLYPRSAALLSLLVGCLGIWLLRWRFQMPMAAFGSLHSAVFYFSLLLVIAGGLSLTGLFLRSQKETFLKTGLLFFTLYFCLVGAEIFLRVKGFGGSYMENRSSKYISVYPHKSFDVDFIIQPYFIPFLQTSEYKYPRLRNNFGFRDKDFEVKKDSSTVLIQTYGDSFTEGDGAPQDSSYPSQLRAMLEKEQFSKNITLQNFGICGSDPGFTYKQMDDIGLELKPDVAVITYSSFDFTADFLTRGGLERFKENYWQAIEGPKWEWLYGLSYVVRLVANSAFGITHTNFFLTEKEKAARLDYLKPKWNETFQRIAQLAEQHHLKVMLFKKPEHSEVDKNEYLYDFTFFENMVDTIPVFKRIDMLSFYRDSLHIQKQNSVNYYWPIDGHHNSTGYNAMAKAVFSGLKKSYPEIFITLDSLKRKQE